MKQTGRRWIGCTLGMLLAVLLLGTTAFAGSADGALGSFVQDKLNELLEEQLLPNVPDQAQGMMDSLTQEKEDSGLFSLLSMTPSELLAAIKDAALQQVSGPLEVLGRLLAVALSARGCRASFWWWRRPVSSPFWGSRSLPASIRRCRRCGNVRCL